MKRSLKITGLFAGILMATSLSFAGPSPTIEADRQGVDNACKAEATTAGCGAEQVGTGLLKCIGAYKKANKTFQVSPGCKAAMVQLKTDKSLKK